MKKRHMLLSTLTLALSLGIFTAPVFAERGGKDNGQGNDAHHGNHGKDKGHSDGRAKGRPAKGNHGELLSVSLSYDRVRPLAVKQGLTGYRRLPPGIAKNLARGKPLPPGIAKKAVPSSLLNQLPHYPGYEWRIAGNDLVLVALSTAIVASVINGVFD
ncbi:anti-virulence regulator CigR family protein [Serratia sp. NPDC078593]|uniref:anti-virulence regulator CigR family protein n=1 Tax=unclassified Serratia (in: enterobacteria) TaxID=2647522 RepID=UPI0037CCFB80